MLVETVALLRGHDFIRGEESVNRDALAEAIAEILVVDPVAEEAEIEAKSLIVPEIRHRLFGPAESEEVEQEIDDLLRPLLSGEGKVQQKVTGELVLCSARVTRRLSNNGAGTITLKGSGRFVTSDPDLIVRYFWGPQKANLEKQAGKLNYRIEMSIIRQPLVAPRRAELVAGTYEQIRLQLPAGETV